MMPSNPSPGDIRATARNDMIDAVCMILTTAHDRGLVSVTEDNKRAAAALIFDQLAHHVTLKVLAGMSTPSTPETS
jgi:hypothetical protein